MKKTIATILIILLMLTSFTLTSNAIGFVVNITPSQINVAPGGTVELTLSAANMNVGDNGINVLSFILHYDKTIFEEITDESIIGLNDWTVSYYAATGKILFDHKGFVKQDSDLCKITFKVKSSVTSGNGEVSVTSPEASDGALDIVGTASSSMIYVKKISSDKYTIDSTKNTITGVTPNTTVEEIKKNLTGSENATIKDKNGNVISNSSGLIGTGSTIEIPGENVFTVIIKADLNGDGKVTLTDVSKMNMHVVEYEILKEPFLTAADLNGDGKISITDASKLKRVIVGSETL